MARVRNRKSTATSITLRAALELTADNPLREGSTRRFTIDPAYSGGALPGETARLPLPVVIDLATLQPRNDRLIATLDHDPEKRVGHVEAIDNDGKQLVLQGVVSASSSAADEVVASAAKGFPWSASIEARLPDLKHVARGETVTINGQSLVGPLLVARNALLTGISFVSAGADSAARALVAASRRSTSMSEDFPHEGDELVAAEQERIARIERLCEGDGYWGSQAERVAEIKAAAIAGDMSYDDARAAVLEALRASRPKLPQRGAAPAPAERVAILTASLCLQAGLPKIERHFPPPVLDAADRAPVCLGSLLLRAAVRGGYYAAVGERINPANLRPVLQAAFAPQLQASGGFSTQDLQNVLSNVANKFLLDGFRAVEDEWRSIARVVPVQNFKATKVVRLLDATEFERVAPTGELKHGTLDDQAMTAQAATYGRILLIPRDAIINDDLGALSDVPRRLGYAAAMSLNREFWKSFLASDGFFGAGNGNVLTGAGTALTVAGTALESALAAFRAQRSSAADGRKRVGGKPAVLLVPPSLEITARRLLHSATIVSTDTAMTPAGNPFQNLAELIVSDWLEDDDLPGNSDSKWYLFRDPMIAPAMLVAALHGRVEPTVETAEPSFDVLGIAMRGYSDVGVSRGEPLCGLQVEGTS